jgi:hypothetical protein
MQKLKPQQRLAPKAEVAPTPVAEAPAKKPDTPPADLSILDLSIAKLAKELASGGHDAHIDALASAEKADKNRKGALAALAGRKA